MKIKNELFENEQYFITLNKVHQSDKLSIVDTYRINRLVKGLAELYTEYRELKQKLLEQFGTPGKPSPSDRPSEVEKVVFEIVEDQKELFHKEMQGLLNIEHDLQMELIPWPTSLEDDLSSADLDIMENFFEMKKFN